MLRNRSTAATSEVPPMQVECGGPRDRPVVHQGRQDRRRLPRGEPRKIGEEVAVGDVLATIYASHPITEEIRDAVRGAFSIVEGRVTEPPIILETIR